jgi:cysteine dioxygenase
MAVPGAVLGMSQRLQSLIASMGDEAPKSLQELESFVSEAGLVEEDLLPWADFDHPLTDSYGRRLIWKSDFVELMVMSWVPGDFSAIHDHGTAHWGVVQSFGPASHSLFRLDRTQIEFERQSDYEPGQIQRVDHRMIHHMGNASSRPFVSLHLYASLQPLATITANARVFDVVDGVIQFTDGGVFFALPADQVKRQLTGLKANPALVSDQRRLRDARLQVMAHA